MKFRLHPLIRAIKRLFRSLRLSHTPTTRIRVRVYIDGFNFYYGITRPYDFKWIDIELLIKRLLDKKISNFTIEQIFFFSSEVIGDEAHRRQQNYFNALQKHSPNIKIQLGRFHVGVKRGKIIGSGEGKIVRVKIREEKETDVNIACKIVDDAHTSAKKDFDISCLISNDGDLSAALKVKQRLRQRTILILPLAEKSASHKPSYPSKSLKALIPVNDRIYPIPKSDVVNSPLPPSVEGLEPPESKGWSI